MNQKNIIVDAIIPVYHPGKEFYNLLEKLSNQSFQLNKIILMNTGSAPAHGACSLPAHTARALGCSRWNNLEPEIGRAHV